MYISQIHFDRQDIIPEAIIYPFTRYAGINISWVPQQISFAQALSNYSHLITVGSPYETHEETEGSLYLTSFYESPISWIICSPNFP